MWVANYYTQNETNETLKRCFEGVSFIILSTHPHSKKEAYKVINEKVNHFNIGSLFDEIHATRKYPKSKGEYILQILKNFNISKKNPIYNKNRGDFNFRQNRPLITPLS